MLLAGAPCAEIIERLLAVVSGDLIMLSDVRAARDFGLVAFDAAAPDADREVLGRLIDRALILAEVERFTPPEPEAAAVERELERVRARFASAESFASALARAGVDERHLRGALRQNLRMAAYLAQRFTALPPTEAELARYYRDHPESFTRGGALQPFETVRPQVVEAVTAEQRLATVDEWLAGLRRRADVRNLY